MKVIRQACLLLAVALSGCATQYGKMGPFGGYTDNRIQSDLFQVSFGGNGYTLKSTSQYYALVRAAEITVLQGRNYFRVLGGSVDPRSTTFTMPGQTYVSSSTSATGSASATAYPIGDGAYRARGTGTYVSDTYATAYTTPGVSGAIDSPLVTLTIQTLPGRIEPCLDAREVLRGAQEKGVKFPPQTLAAMAASPSRR